MNHPLNPRQHDEPVYEFTHTSLPLAKQTQVVDKDGVINNIVEVVNEKLTPPTDQNISANSYNLDVMQAAGIEPGSFNASYISPSIDVFDALSKISTSVLTNVADRIENSKKQVEPIVSETPS